MATIYFGSARHDENGNYVNGTAGDSLQKSTPDYSGEVSMQEMYKHSKGWTIFRPKTVANANAIAERMTAACNNSHIGYDQNGRYGIITYGIDTTTNTECDCSSLVRECIKEATGKDPGDFNTESEPSVLMATGLFDNMGSYTSQSATPVANGDVLCTPVKGHTGIICSGNPRTVTYKEGWVQESNGKWWWQYADGSYPTMCWLEISESDNPDVAHWYLFGSSGYMIEGWAQWDSAKQKTGSGDWYYLEEGGAHAGACWHETDARNGSLERWDIKISASSGSASSNSSSGVGPGYK